MADRRVVLKIVAVDEATAVLETALLTFLLEPLLDTYEKEWCA